MGDNDTDVIGEVRSEDLAVRSRAIEKIYVKYYPFIKTFILKNNGSLTDAEDVYQDAMIVLYAKLRDKNFELSCTLKTYVFSICRNLWMSKLKERKRFDDFVKDGAYISISQDDFRPLEIEEKQKKLKRLFSQIGENCQRVLHLFYFHRLSMNAIAQELGLANEQVAKNKKSRCLKKLKAIAFKMPYKEPYG